MIDLKRALRQRRVTIGSWITLSHPAIAEIMANSGFEWLAVDMEHSAIGIGEAQDLIRVIGLSGCVPIVRVGANDAVIIKRVMDAGAHGVIVPMINSREDALAAVDAVRYPPAGKRGVGLARAQGYGFGFDEYMKWAGENSVVIVQIEHAEAVSNLDDILSVEGVDGFIVGPYDLSASMGVPGDFNHPKVREAFRAIRRATLRHKNVSPGFHVVPPDATQAARKIKEGYRFIGFSLDTMFLGTNCRDGLAKLKGAAK
jgi:2-dehydro-3-deoxyglucarate aldolase